MCRSVPAYLDQHPDKDSDLCEEYLVNSLTTIPSSPTSNIALFFSHEAIFCALRRRGGVHNMCACMCMRRQSASTARAQENYLVYDEIDRLDRHSALHYTKHTRFRNMRQGSLHTPPRPSFACCVLLAWAGDDDISTQTKQSAYLRKASALFSKPLPPSQGPLFAAHKHTGFHMTSSHHACSKDLSPW